MEIYIIVENVPCIDENDNDAVYEVVCRMAGYFRRRKDAERRAEQYTQVHLKAIIDQGNEPLGKDYGRFGVVCLDKVIEHITVEE